MVVATHSSEFLIGCVEAVAETQIVRLTFDRELNSIAGTGTARSLASSDVTAMVNDPLLRSTDVLRALFHKAAVITEADADRAFYDEMNRRLRTDGRGLRDTLFLNAQNKDTVHRLVGPLRRLGVPAVALTDLDALNLVTGAWENLVTACQIPSSRWSALDEERNYLWSIFRALPETAPGKKAIHSQGIRALTAPDRARATALLAEVAQYGLFLVPNGALETWLAHLGVQGSKQDWLPRIFERIGGLMPSNDDVWTFIDQIAGWVNDRDRLGLM